MIGGLAASIAYAVGALFKGKCGQPQPELEIETKEIQQIPT
jgi:hypothetical protein